MVQPVKPQFEIQPMCETAVNESLQIAFFKKAELGAAVRRQIQIYLSVNYNITHTKSQRHKQRKATSDTNIKSGFVILIYKYQT